MLAVIGDSANAASIGVHRALGFVPVGTIRSAGWKFERWLDVVLMQKALGAGDAGPPPSRSGVSARPAPASQAVAIWLAIVGGSLGLHRFYLHGGRDLWAWLHPWPTLVGAYGLWRLRQLGLDDTRRAAGSSPCSARWSRSRCCRRSSAASRRPSAGASASAGRGAAAGWATVIGLVVAVALGATATMATIAFAAQRYFE